MSLSAPCAWPDSTLTRPIATLCLLNMLPMKHAIIHRRIHANYGRLTKTPKTIPVNTTDWIGSAAAALTTTAFIPQAWKVWRTRHTADISLVMYALFTLGVAMWLIYGALLESWPIVIANCITLLLAGAVLVMKLKFG